jgi:hypothetical protein
MQSADKIKEPVLRELISAADVVNATVEGMQNGFAVVVRFGAMERVLATSKGIVRMFASLDTASAFVREIGICRFEVDMTNHQPGRLRGPRPDRSEALKRTRTRPQQQPLEFINERARSI